MMRIVAIGGGGFLMEDERSPIDDYILALTGKSRPRICFIPTPSGDAEEHLEKFYAAFAYRDCKPSHLAFFRKQRAGSLPLPDYAQHLLGQDAVFVGGGNTRSALAVWREWKLDSVLQQAWSAGIVLSGMSAGALCWFQVGVSDSFGDSTYRPLQGLGFLPGTCAAHYNGTPERRACLHASLEAGEIGETIAIDECAAVLFSGTAVERVVSWRAGCTAYRVSRDPGRVHEIAYASERLRPAGGPEGPGRAT
jgi:peptidase E